MTATPEPGAPIQRPATRLELSALAGILLVATLLVSWNIGREGTSNVYYAAAVRAMLQDPVAFLFAGFDPGRYITLDKPPLGYQLQAVSAAVLGFGGPALLLPQLVAGVLSVLLVHALVRPAWGGTAALIGAGALAVMPVSVAVARNTTVDATLVATLLLGAAALQRGLRTGRLRWLALAFALVGVGFELKMLQAWLVLPAFGAAWLVAAPGAAGTRVRQLGAAGVPLLLVSFAWAAVVAAWPVEYRPWIGGSTSNSLLDLAFGYNGLNRLVTGPAYADTGPAGPLRFLEPVLVTQVGWLLPLAALGVLLGLPAAWRAGGLGRGSAVLWSGWLVTCLVFFSVARFWHRHYLVVVAPSIAVLAAIGLVAGWRAYRGAGRSGWLLPFAVAADGVLAAFTIANATDLRWLAEPALAAGILVAAALLALRATRRLLAQRTLEAGSQAGLARLGAILAGAALVGSLVPPAAWSVWTVAGPDPVEPVLPVGGPPIAWVQPGPVSGGGGGDGRAFDPRPDPALIAFLTEHRGGASWALAVEGAIEAAPTVADTGLPIMAIGGFQGRDPAIDLDGFRWLIREGRLRFVSAGEKFEDDPGAEPLPPTAAELVLDWVVATCARVPAFERLYDCDGRG